VIACRGGDKPAQKAEPASVSAPKPGPVAASSDMDPGHCGQQPFAESTPLPEASGAAWLVVEGKLSLVVVSDSGNNGAYAVLDPDTGATREEGKLPLGTGAGDDIEGFAAHDGKLFGLTSDGWMRVWQRKGSGFELIDGPYAIGDQADGTTCPTKKKCAINYEGLALAATPKGCAGFACSKGEGRVYCLTEQAGHYAIDHSRSIAVTKPNALGDCTFDDKDGLWVGDNVFGLDQVFRIDGWSAPATAKVLPVNAFGVGFPEVIAVRGDVIYRMSDTGGSPSLLGKFRCLPSSR